MEFSQRIKLEAKNKAGAELETVLAGGKKLRANVVGFKAQGKDRRQVPISTATELSSESFLPQAGLREDVDSAGKNVGPGLPAVPAPDDARSPTIDNEPRGLIIQI